MNANSPDYLLLFINQNGSIFDKTLSSEGRRRFKHALNKKAAQGAKAFLTVTDCGNNTKSMTHVRYYKDVQL